MRVLAVTNIYPTPALPTCGTFVEQQVKGLRQVGINVDVLFVNRAQKGMKEYLGLGKRLHTRCENFCPDIVHSMFGGVMAAVTTRVVRDRPTVVSFCGSDLLGQNLAGPLRKIISGFGVRASWKAARRAHGIVVKSRNLFDSLPNDIKRSSKVRIIPNGVDLSKFRPLDRDKCREELGWTSNSFHLLFPANLGDPVKRFFLAKAAAEILNNTGNRVEIHQLRDVSHEKVPIWINASDALLLTSLQEGSPNIIKEALACDIPVVSVDVGDVKERINKIEGCYIALPDPRDLADKLKLVQGGMGRVSGRVSMKELSLEQVAITLTNFYQKLLLGSLQPIRI